jgi:hypothetical protein
VVKVSCHSHRRKVTIRAVVWVFVRAIPRRKCFQDKTMYIIMNACVMKMFVMILLCKMGVCLGMPSLCK